MFAPIILFVYNRPEHTRKTVEALSRNALALDSELWVFSDAAKSPEASKEVEDVRRYIYSLADLHLFKSISIVEATENKGLAKSIIDGVTTVIKDSKRVIVLEDDLVTAPDFLSFMNECLVFYKDNSQVGSVTGYSPIEKLPEDYSESVYMIPRSSSLGWATWIDRWKNVDWDVTDYEKFKASFQSRREFDQCGSDRSDRLRRQMKADIGSWSIRFGYWQFRIGMNTIYSAKTRILNIGNDGTGVHNATGAKYNDDLSNKPVPFKLTSPPVDARILSLVKEIYSGTRLSRFSRLLRNNGFERLEAVLRKVFMRFANKQ